jgi:DNA-binding response OmpR family regulator
MRVLVVDDEKDIRQIIRLLLENAGYEVIEAQDGAAAVALLGEDRGVDLVIMDVMMPRLSGVEATEKIRTFSTVPVLFLTARDSITDKVTGLGAGGDYYLTKPFSFDELNAVVKVMARKYTGNKTNEYSVADMTVDTDARTVVRAGKSVDLTAKEFALLEYMIRNRGVVLSREMIEDNLWNFDYEGGTNVVDVYIGYLRRKIDKGFDKKLIHTVRGTGWVLREDD